MLITGCATGARAVTAEWPAGISVPANLNVPPRHREIVERMWLTSPTFRRQCARIERAGESLAVELRDQASPRMAGVRAWTDIESRAGRRHTAIVFLKVEYQEQIVELIAHEMEHVLEWLDGVDYATRGHGRAVKFAADGAVETIRATMVGRQVAREVSREPIPGDASANGMLARNAGARR